MASITPKPENNRIIRFYDSDLVSSCFFYDALRDLMTKCYLVYSGVDTFTNAEKFLIQMARDHFNTNNNGNGISVVIPDDILNFVSALREFPDDNPVKHEGSFL
jgi:hypothetical protein